MKFCSLRDRIAWLDILIGSMFMGLAAMILQLFSRPKRDGYASDQRLHLVVLLLLAALGFLFHHESRPNRKTQKRE